MRLFFVSIELLLPCKKCLCGQRYHNGNSMTFKRLCCNARKWIQDFIQEITAVNRQEKLEWRHGKHVVVCLFVCPDSPANCKKKLPPLNYETKVKVSLVQFHGTGVWEGGRLIVHWPSIIAARVQFDSSPVRAARTTRGDVKTWREDVYLAYASNYSEASWSHTTTCRQWLSYWRFLIGAVMFVIRLCTAVSLAYGRIAVSMQTTGEYRATIMTAATHSIGQQ